MNNPFTLSPAATQSMRFLKPLMVLALIILVCDLATYFVLVRPMQGQLSEVQVALNVLRQQQQSGQTAQITQQALQELWQDLPSQQEFTHLGISINTLAKRNMVRIPEMEYRVESLKRQSTPKGSITFQAFGAYDAIRRFIYQLEETKPYLIIEKLTAKRTKEPNQVAFTFQLETFFRPPSAHMIVQETTS